MMRGFLLACGLSLLQGTACADDRKWVGFSPCLILVHEVDKAAGSLVFRQAEENVELLEKEVQSIVDGKIEKRKIPYFQPVRPRPRQVTFSLKDTKVYDTTGKLLGEAEILKRVKPGMAVVIARRGDKIGLDYLFVLKRETPILVLLAHQEVPKPEPLPVSGLIPALEAFADICDEFIARCFPTRFVMLPD